jgi:hypothetical protein
MVVDVCFPPMLLLRVLVRDVHVIHCRVVVLVSVSGEQVPPVLSLVQVVRDVIMLVAVLQVLMLVVSLLPRHNLSPLPARLSTCPSAVYIETEKRAASTLDPVASGHRLPLGRNATTR